MEITISGESIVYGGLAARGWNLYVPGIRFGAHNFKRFNKIYTYVALPESKNWIFLRTAAFIQVDLPNTDEPHYVLVHDVASKATHSWDPPKGQVEYKEFETIKTQFRTPRTRLHGLLREGIHRELLEEAKIDIKDVRDFTELDLVVAGHHNDLPNHFHYQYHLFEGHISYKTFLKALKELDMLRNNPQLTLNMSKDVLEKDRIALWKPSDGLKMILAGDPQKIVRVFCAYKGFKIG
jgi:8-oxo-dGTP pyrophosphatase MutT (NUDIX family)